MSVERTNRFPWLEMCLIASVTVLVLVHKCDSSGGIYFSGVNGRITQLILNYTLDIPIDSIRSLPGIPVITAICFDNLRRISVNLGVLFVVIYAIYHLTSYFVASRHIGRRAAIFGNIRGNTRSPWAFAFYSFLALICLLAVLPGTRPDYFVIGESFGAIHLAAILDGVSPFLLFYVAVLITRTVIFSVGRRKKRNQKLKLIERNKR